MTFTNRTGQDVFIKLSSNDEEKILRASDSRVCFLCQETSDCNKLQVFRLYTELINFGVGYLPSFLASIGKGSFCVL